MFNSFVHFFKVNSLRNISTMMKTKNLVGVCQMRSTKDKMKNREQVEILVKQAKDQEVQFLFFPECCDYVGENAKETIELAEPLTGDTVKFYKDLCRNNKMWMSFGGIHETVLDERGNKTDFVNNTHLLINQEGEIAATYRKLHLFDVDTPEFKYRESKLVKAGKSLTLPVDTLIGKIGMLICYDIRFPEVSIWLRKNGAQILSYPSAFSYSTGKAHWEILNRSRAIENQSFVISAAQIGKHNDRRESWGNAMIVSPWGEILTQCTQELEVKVVDLNLEAIDKVVNNMPCFNHRRDDVYSLEAKYNSPKMEESKYFMFENNKVDRRTIFMETELCVAFTNIRCVVPGHVLICTKRNIPRVEEMTVEETKDFFIMVTKISKVLEKYYDAKSNTITVQDGPYAGQTVKHVHCHVMPRKPNDFAHNDMIYTELNKHDGKEPEQKRRPLQEMIDECEIYKKLF